MSEYAQERNSQTTTEMLSEFAQVATAIASTKKKSEKEAILADYLIPLDDSTLERAVIFFSGSPFANKEEKVTGIGWATIADALVEAMDSSHERLREAMQHHGDLGDAVAEVMVREKSGAAAVTLLELAEAFEAMAATRGSIRKREILTALIRRLTPEEARVVVKILLSEFRIGLQEGLVESALAKAFGRGVKEVRRAHMLNGDLGATALLAKGGMLEQASLHLFTPVALMLAQPEEDPHKIIAHLGEGAWADDKYDGIRAQLHISEGEVRIYSRTLDQITHRFPEIESAARQLSSSSIIDGEIVAFNGRILPFAVIQKRLGRRKVSAALLEGAPAAFFAFDLLYLDGESLLETPLEGRLEKLRSFVTADGTIRLSFQREVQSGEEVDAAFEAARGRANEGLVIKDPRSLYTPGRRGKAWLKYKKALATLDCVITAAEFGHGNRRGVLSDYTFAVRRESELVNIGKAYSGLTDVEIDRMTARLKELTTAQYGPVHVVRPEIVLEIAFDRIQESKRHKSGYALRFPRIARLREDKNVDQISTIEEVRTIYEGQLRREGLGEGG